MGGTSRSYARANLPYRVLRPDPAHSFSRTMLTRVVSENKVGDFSGCS